MNTKRTIALIICAIMLLSMIPMVLMNTGAAEVDGMWNTHRFATAYDDPDETTEEGDEPSMYQPEAGYTYTEEGFQIVPADYTGFTPQLSVVSTEKQSAKDGIYLQFRVDDYCYDGGTGADQWICLSLTTGGRVAPGSTEYGGGWLTLIRGNGNGACTIQPHLTDPKTEDFGGTFNIVGNVTGEATMDDQGREIYTLEVTHNGSAYEIKVNGVVMPASDQTTTLLDKLDANGEFYVGINMQAAVKDGTAALTILKYGTSEADAVTPVGSDSKEPEENIHEEVTIADPNSVEPGKPAILWDPTTYNTDGGNNCTFTVLGDNTWRVNATETAVFFNFTPKRKWAYDAVDFPVFGIMVRNIWVDSGTLWYAAGDVQSAQNDCTLPFSIYDGESWEDAEGIEYFFVPVDLTDLWEGKINTIRLDLAMSDPENREFDICFAGMFRSEDEAYSYAEGYLKTTGVLPEDYTKAPETTAAPKTEAPETDPVEVGTNGSVGTGAGNSETTGTTDEGGCASVVGFGAVAVLAAAAAAVVLKKKD